MSTNILSTKVLNGNNITGHHVKSTKTFVKNFTKSNPPKSTKIDQNVKAALLKGAGKVESQVKLENATLAKSTPLAQASQKGGGNDSPIKKALTTIDENQNYEPKSMSAPTMDGNNGPEASVIEYSKTATQTIVSETGSLVSATLNSVSNPQDVYLDEDLTDEQNTLFDKLRNECETLDNDVKKFAQNLTEFQKMDPKTRKD